VLCGYDWPGNIRELANVLERAQILAEGNVITIDDLPENLIQVSKPTPISLNASPVSTPDDLEVVERKHVEEVLRKCGNNKVHASKALGISRRTLYRLIEKYGFGDRGTEDAAPVGESEPI
jgi:two-component system NtrC family response regulator